MTLTNLSTQQTKILPASAGESDDYSLVESINKLTEVLNHETSFCDSKLTGKLEEYESEQQKPLKINLESISKFDPELIFKPVNHFSVPSDAITVSVSNSPVFAAHQVRTLKHSILVASVILSVATLISSPPLWHFLMAKGVF